MSDFNPTFQALLKEAQFTKQLLGAGATDIRRANYATKGTYFLAFTSLSTGLERIGKLCLMLDHYIETRDQFPDLDYLKKNIGHNISLLQDKAIQVCVRRNLRITPPNSPAHQAIVKILSDFAKGDRYSNIDLLVGSSRQSNPISAWFSEVDLPIFESMVSAKKKRKIEANSRLISEMISSISHVAHISETGSDIDNVEEASYRTGVYEAVSPYRQLYVLQIIRYWCNLIRKLQYMAMDLGTADIPFFGEIFAPFENDDSYMRTRKIWNTI